MLLDSNIIIYAARPEHAFLREFISETSPAVSAISYVEVLGYHKLTSPAREQFRIFFESAQILGITQVVIDNAVILRQKRNITLGDSLIAATAISYSLTLVTRNVTDFTWITELDLLNPFEDKP